MKIESVNQCENCPRKCKCNRQTQKGYCGVTTLKVARAELHFGEEPPISGKNGSGTIFFSGCNLKCVYCQNSEISEYAFGKEISIERLAEIFKELENKGANNINLVTPTHFVDSIIKAFNIYKPKIPVVYNTSGYESCNVIKKLKPYVDIYLTDLKYCDSEISNKYSKAPDYFSVATKAILEMRKNCPEDVFNSSGIMQKGIIIRHLVLPNNIEDSKKCLNWICENLGNKTYISLMGQYVPHHKAKDYKEINRKLKPVEYKIVLNHANKLGFSNGFVQSLDSATDEYLPSFNLQGV